MDNVFSKLGNDEIMALAGILAGILLGGAAILGGISVAITQVVSSHRRRMQLDEMDATLKMEMIQRGMSGDEIAQVLKARTGADRNVNLNFNGLQGLKKPLEFAKQHEKA